MSTPNTVAVTGAAGYIGSHLCQNLVHHGYHVRACVRSKDAKRHAHLLAMIPEDTPTRSTDGSLEIYEADMMKEGSYDAIFAGCQAVFHVAGSFGTDRRWMTAASDKSETTADTIIVDATVYYNQGVYDSYVVPMQHVLDSIVRSKTVKKLIYTSSGCAGTVVSDNDSDDEYSISENAYGKGKVDCEKLIYNFGVQHDDIVCCSSCPTHVLGPILAGPLHDMAYQHRLGEIFAGKYCLNMDWNVCDVRDIADTQRRILEDTSTTTGSSVKNGSRFYNGAPDEDELTPGQLVALLVELFPERANQIANAPENNDSQSDASSSSSSSKSDNDSGSNLTPQLIDWASTRTSRWGDPEEVLGLQRHSVAETIRDTILSLEEFDMIDRKDLSTQELRNFYQVAEMDGCDEEIEYILSELKKRGEAAESGCC
jgi:nucleoside-diphosphate-sugar epimerase